MSIKFYNNTTEFLDDEIIEETNVLFEDEQDQIKEDTSPKDTSSKDTSQFDSQFEKLQAARNAEFKPLSRR